MNMCSANEYIQIANYIAENTIISAIAEIVVELTIEGSLHNLGNLSTHDIYGKHNKYIYYARNKIIRSVHKINKACLLEI